MVKNVIRKLVEKRNYNFHEGDCGDLAVTLKEHFHDGKVLGVRAFDGDIVHAIFFKDGVYYDENGDKEEQEIKEEWAYDRSPDNVDFVALSLDGDMWTYNGEEVMSANKIEI
ncbi:MAG: hypothetical protein GY801_02365 [bacterium]|nr:hypothetical protein [bacterium]